MAITKERLKELAQPVLKGLFGKQLPYHLRVKMEEEEKPPVRPIGMIVTDLCRLPDDAWAKYAFSREPLNGKFTDEQRVELAAKATECGRAMAERMAAEYGSRDPVQLARKMGLIVDYPQVPQNASRVLFAEFKEPDKVFIYMDGVEKGNILMKEPGVRRALGSQFEISPLLLGHEIFHWVELNRPKELWSSTYKIRLWKIGPLHNDSTIITLGEIAAMAFAQALCGIKWHPYVMDSYLVYGYSPEAASALYEEMMTFAGLTPRLPEEATTEDALPPQEALPEAGQNS